MGEGQLHKIAEVRRLFVSNERGNDEIMWIIQLVLPVQQIVDLIEKLSVYSSEFCEISKYVPIQFRDPAENGIYANGGRSLDVEGSLAKRSGSNFSGFG